MRKRNGYSLQKTRRPPRRLAASTTRARKFQTGEQIGEPAEQRMKAGVKLNPPLISGEGSDNPKKRETPAIIAKKSGTSRLTGTV
jgi:hypothetical protein